MLGKSFYEIISSYCVLQTLYEFDLFDVGSVLQWLRLQSIGGLCILVLRVGS